jgi:D-arginine dehydrogenase
VHVACQAEAVESYDVLVVGGGIAGVSLAYELAADHRVGLLEREGVLAAHSTGRSAATFIESYGGVEMRALAKASRPFLDHPPAGFDQPLLTARGALFVGSDDDHALVREMYDDVRPLNNQVQLLDTDECATVCSLLRRERRPVAVLDPDAMDMDVHALHQGYARGLRHRGGTIRTTAPVRRLEPLRAGWLATTTDGSAVRARVVVDAAGAWADEVARMAGAAPVGLQPLVRSVFVVARPELPGAARWPLVHDVAARFYVKPEGDGLLCSPADETPARPGDPRPDELAIARTIEDLGEQTLLQVHEVRTSWAGLRVFAPDRVPVVGFDPRRAGLFWLAGQGGSGIQTAPAMARLAAALVRRQDVPADMAALGVTAAALSPARLCAR